MGQLKRYHPAASEVLRPLRECTSPRTEHTIPLGPTAPKRLCHGTKGCFAPSAAAPPERSLRIGWEEETIGRGADGEGWEGEGSREQSLIA